MISTFAILLVVLVVLGGMARWAWVAWIRPVKDIQAALRAVREEAETLPIVRSRAPMFAEMATTLGQIASQLAGQRRQLADEVFSLRAILGSMVEGIMIVDPTMRIRLANDALYSMFDLRQSPINRTVIEVFREHKLLAGMERSFKDCRSINLELQTDVRMAAGNPEKFYRVNIAPLLPKGGPNPVGALVVFNDITEVRTLEAIRREFVANVSHEFRTPLAIITGYVETLLDGALDDRPMAERSLHVIQKHGQRLNLLIDDLLTISRMEHRSVELERRSISLRELLNRVIEQQEALIRERQMAIRIDIAPEADIIDVDPPRIEQVFLNLLTNALQYAIRRDAELWITARLRGHEVEICFADNGPGIPYEDQPHIFERFYRVHKDRSRDAGGTGLGLSIVRNVVLAHGGHVSLRSTPGAGSTFRVILPLAPDH